MSCRLRGVAVTATLSAVAATARAESPAEIDYSVPAADAATTTSEPAKDAPNPALAMLAIQRRGTSWDLDLSGGYAVAWDAPDAESRFSGRLRAGVLVVREPTALAAGLVGEVGGLTEYGGGLGLEALHTGSGVWLQPSYVVGKGFEHYLRAGVGWSVLGLEGTRSVTSSAFAVEIRLRVPLGIAYFLATH